MIDPDRYQTNIWDLYPQKRLTLKKVYDKDDSENKEDSSSVIWGIVLLEHPKSEFQYYPYEERKIAIAKALGKVDWDEELIRSVVDSFFTPEARSLSLWNKKIEERDAFMLNEVYTMSNAEDMDKLLKNTKVIKDGYRKAKEEYENSLGTADAQIQGGAVESYIEKLTRN